MNVSHTKPIHALNPGDQFIFMFETGINQFTEFDGSRVFYINSAGLPRESFMIYKLVRTVYR